MAAWYPDPVPISSTLSGYARYDFKTATKLLEATKHLIERYGSDLKALHDSACDATDVKVRLKSLGKGIAT